MENTNEKEQFKTAPEADETGYVPRPAWQVWGARIALVLFILFVIWQIMNIAGGGL